MIIMIIICIYADAMVLSVLLHGAAESWALSRTQLLLIISCIQGGNKKGDTHGSNQIGIDYELKCMTQGISKMFGAAHLINLKTLNIWNYIGTLLFL